MYGIVAVPMEITVIPAMIDIKPNVLNLRSNSRWITCILWLPEEDDLYEVDPWSLQIEGIVGADRVVIDEVENTMIIKFLWDQVRGLLMPGETSLTVTGQLYDGTLLEGSDTVIIK